MNVMMITSLNTYTSNMKMEMKWKEKRLPAISLQTSMTIEERLRKEAQENMGMGMGKSKVSLGQIQTKLMSGKKLSSEEMDYLKENNPELYKKAKEIEMEREAYEQELKQCKTKEDVQRVKLAHATAAMAPVKDIESNPNIPEGQKLALIMEQMFKTNALGDVERKFTQSGEYKRLPTEEEERQAEEDLKEAQEAERGIEDKTDDTPQEVSKDAAQKAKEDSEETTDGTVRDDMSAPDQKPVLTDASKKAKDVMENTYSRDVRRKKVIAAKTRMTRAEAEVTPEAQKVKRARAKAAYTKTPHVGDMVGSVVNVKK